MGRTRVLTEARPVSEKRCYQKEWRIAIASKFLPVRVVSRNGNFKYILQNSHGVSDIAITSNNHCLVTGTKVIHRYDNEGIHLGTISTYVDKRRVSPHSIAVDSHDNIIAAFGKSMIWGANAICVYHSDTTVSTFKTDQCPRKLTCTPDDQIVVT